MSLTRIALLALLGCQPTTIDADALRSSEPCYEWPVSSEPGAKRVRPDGCSDKRRTLPESQPPPDVDRDAGVPLRVDADVVSPAPDAPAECTEARVRELFARDLTAGGCQDSEYGGCHEAPDGAPWLLAADLRSELLGKKGECELAWIGPSLAESLLWQKITSSPASPPSCGEPMPPREFGVAMDAAALDCVESWMASVIAARL